MTQLDFPFSFQPDDLRTFLTRASAIEDEMDRLREEMRALRDEYADVLPLRGVTTALKVVRARRKLENHPKEPMRLVHQALLEGEVERTLAHLDTEKAHVAPAAAMVGSPG